MTKPFIIERVCPGTKDITFRGKSAKEKAHLFPFQAYVKVPSTSFCPRCGEPNYRIEGNSLSKLERLFGFEHIGPRWICGSSGHLK